MRSFKEILEDLLANHKQQPTQEQIKALAEVINEQETE